MSNRTSEKRVEKLRVVLANIPQIPRQLLRDLVNQQRDMAVVGEVRTLGELPAAVAALQGEVVILTFSPSCAGEQVCCALREHHPSLTLVGLAVRHDRAVIWPPLPSRSRCQRPPSSAPCELQHRPGTSTTPRLKPGACRKELSRDADQEGIEPWIAGLGPPASGPD